METRGFDWVCRTIETCNSIFQLETAEKIIENYKRKTKDDFEVQAMYLKFRRKAEQYNYYDYKQLKI